MFRNLTVEALWRTILSASDMPGEDAEAILDAAWEEWHRRKLGTPPY